MSKYTIYFSFDCVSHIHILSYDAAEDNEITFREGDRITEIEPASEDWWQGTNQHGEIGLFPGMSELSPWSGWRLMDVGVANYVEVQE